MSIKIEINDLKMYSLDELKDIKKLIMKSYGKCDGGYKDDDSRLYRDYNLLDVEISQRIWCSWKESKDYDRKMIRKLGKEG